MTDTSHPSHYPADYVTRYSGWEIWLIRRGPGYTQFLLEWAGAGDLPVESLQSQTTYGSHELAIEAAKWVIERLTNPCPHRNTIIEMRGCRRLVEGQVDDDFHEVEVCKDCGADLTPQEE